MIALQGVGNLYCWEVVYSRPDTVWLGFKFLTDGDQGNRVDVDGDRAYVMGRFDGVIANSVLAPLGLKVGARIGMHDWLMALNDPHLWWGPIA